MQHLCLCCTPVVVFRCIHFYLDFPRVDSYSVADINLQPSLLSISTPSKLCDHARLDGESSTLCIHRVVLLYKFHCIHYPR